MFRREELDYRTREVQLYEALHRRFYWDVLKLVLAVLYPIGRFYAYVNAASIGSVPVIGEFLASPPWDALVTAGAIPVVFQFKNIRDYRSRILSKAKSMAYKHGLRGGSNR